MRSDFRRFLAWGVSVPLGFPLVIIFVYLLTKGSELTLGTIFGRPAFLLFSAALFGESYAVVASMDKPTSGPVTIVHNVNSIFIPFFLVSAAGLYGFAETNSILYQTDLLAICVLVLVGISILAELSARLCYNKDPEEVGGSGLTPKEGE